MIMKSTKVTFENTDGDVLSGSIDLPLGGKPKAYVLFAHCFTCSKNLQAVKHISDAFTQQGMAILRFDFTGLGQSKGAFADTNFSSNLSDLKEAYRFMEEVYEAPQILVGHSLGGAAALHVAGSLPKVQAVATVGAPATPTHVSHLLEQGREDLESKGVAEIDIGGRPITIKKQFLDDLQANEAGGTIRQLKKALLIMHSPQDTIVGINNAQEIYQEAMHPKSFVSLDRADHLLTDEADARYVAMMIARWAERYVRLAPQEEMPEGEVRARLAGAQFTTELTAGRHQMLADEPTSIGGADEGPTPYGYLLSALGACTAMTLRMYANHKGIALREVDVQLTHDKIHKEDTGNAEQSKGKIDQIKRIIHLEGDFTDEQRQRLLQIADRCPVHKTLEGKPEILTEGDW